MEELKFTRLRRLIALESSSVALTAYLPVIAESELDSKKIGKIQEKAEKALSKVTDLREAENFRTNLDYAINILLEEKYTDGTWVIAATPTTAEAIFVPFLFDERVEVAKKLNVADVVYAFYRIEKHFVALLSENVARFYECIGDRLFSVSTPPIVKEALHQLQKARQQLQGSAGAGDMHYQQLFGQMARSAFQMALVKYEDELATLARHYGLQEGYPIILAGDERLIQAIADKTSLTQGLTKISGIYELTPPEQLLQYVRQHTEYQRTLLLQAYKPFLDYSDPQAPQDIWTILQDSQTAGRPILFVAEGYTFPAKELIGAKRGLPTNDAVNLIVEKVREKGGEVIFLPSSELPSPMVLLVP